MNLPKTRYTILVGNYGSGKTELSLALALEMRKSEPESRIALVDLDIVNPYFRSAEQGDLLRQHNIEVFMPSFAMSTVDIPALPANIMAVFEQPFDRVIIDVGGDDTGATALGRYAPQLTARREEITDWHGVSVREYGLYMYRLVIRCKRLIRNRRTDLPPDGHRLNSGVHATNVRV